MAHKLEAKVKQNYSMGSVVAFSGHEYSRDEWRPVPAGFEAAALAHPLLDVREAESQEDIAVTSQDVLADTLGTADRIAAETPREVVGEERVTAVTEPDKETPSEEGSPSVEKAPPIEEVPPKVEAPEKSKSSRRSSRSKKE